jgi:D-xylose 1-dehydrogenase
MKFATYPSVAGKIVLVTGGASGIGAEIVRAFVGQGARVAFLDLDEAAAASLVDELAPAELRFARCDLRDIPALREALADLEAVLGPASVLVNNAARDNRHVAWCSGRFDPHDIDERRTRMVLSIFAQRPYCP